jgi:hypothetical protein
MGATVFFKDGGGNDIATLSMRLSLVILTGATLPGHMRHTLSMMAGQARALR